jgi:UDP-glucose 4-epimerase
MGNKILVTGGAGFIGSHTVIALIENGFEPIIYDDLSNSSEIVIDRIEQISGKRPDFIKADVRDKKTLSKVFSNNKITGIIHFAGLKAVGESVEKPLLYYQVNLGSTLSLLEMAKKYECSNFLFSSSATVYDDLKVLEKFEETSSTGRSTNPYGTTKIMQEWILDDIVTSKSFAFKAIALRYFNPVGAHPSGLIGEDPKGIPNNLSPFICGVAVGKYEKLRIFGNDYNTPDGTCIRDFVHVVDLANGHILALKYLLKKNDKYLMDYINLGTGKGSSVLELLNAFNKAVGKELPYEFAPKRPGDVPANFANTEKAHNVLGFKAEKSIFDMAKDSYNWQKINPIGFTN